MFRRPRALQDGDPESEAHSSSVSSGARQAELGARAKTSLHLRLGLRWPWDGHAFLARLQEHLHAHIKLRSQVSCHQAAQVLERNQKQLPSLPKVHEACSGRVGLSTSCNVGLQVGDSRCSTAEPNGGTEARWCLQLPAGTVQEPLLGPLRVGFAIVEAQALEDWPKCELRITALHDDTSDDMGKTTLFQFLDFALDMLIFSKGFVLTYDLRKLGSIQVGFVCEVIAWMCEPGRQSKWQQRCAYWKVIVPEGASFHTTRFLLSGIFFIYSPCCLTYLMTDTCRRLDTDALRFEPDSNVSLETRMLTNLGDLFSWWPSMFVESEAEAVELVADWANQVALSAALEELRIEEERRSNETAGGYPLHLLTDRNEFDASSSRGSDFMPDAAHSAMHESPGTEAQAVQNSSDSGLDLLAKEAQEGKPKKLVETLRPIVDIGFATLTPGYDPKSQLGFVRMTCKDGTYTEENVRQFCDTLDAFVESDDAVNGFSISYDFRFVCRPSVAKLIEVLQDLAKWGAEPARQAKWLRLNKECKVVVNGGFQYYLAKSVMCTFFSVCPPVCRTVLLYDPDQDDSDAVAFEPPANCNESHDHEAGAEQLEPFAATEAKSEPDAVPMLSGRGAENSEEADEAVDNSTSSSSFSMTATFNMVVWVVS